MAFLEENAVAVSDEVRLVYVDIMGRNIYNLFKAYHSQLAKLEEELKVMTDAAAQFETDSEACKKELQTSKEETGNGLTRIEGLRVQLKGYVTSEKNLVAGSNQMQEKLNEARAAAQKQQEENATLRDAAKKRVAEMEQLKGEIANLKPSEEKGEAEMKQLRACQKEMKRMNRKYDDLKRKATLLRTLAAKRLEERTDLLGEMYDASLEEADLRAALAEREHQINNGIDIVQTTRAKLEQVKATAKGNYEAFLTMATNALAGIVLPLPQAQAAGSSSSKRKAGASTAGSSPSKRPALAQAAGSSSSDPPAPSKQPKRPLTEAQRRAKNGARRERYQAMRPEERAAYNAAKRLPKVGGKGGKAAAVPVVVDLTNEEKDQSEEDQSEEGEDIDAVAEKVEEPESGEDG